MIMMAYQALKKDDLSYAIDRDQEIVACSVDIKYTIAWSQWKGVSITSNRDYERLLEEATKKTNPEVKIMMTELKVSPLSTFAFGGNS
jgi:hypothetical protein